MHRTTQRTEFGEALARFMFDNNLPMTVVARDAGVSYETLRGAMYGRTPGRDIIPAVEEFMRNYQVNSKGA